MKKTIAIILIIICILSIGAVYAAETNRLEEKNVNEITEFQSKMDGKKEKYTEKYGGEGYWFAGYVLEEIIQPYSIPLCFLGIVIRNNFPICYGNKTFGL